MADDYLWDGKGEPDPDVAELERALRPLRYEPRAMSATPRAAVTPLRPRPRAWWGVLAAAAIAAIATTATVRSMRESAHMPPVAARLPKPPKPALPASPSFSVERIEGAPRVGAAPIAAASRLGVGEWLETDASSRARIAIADIGSVEVAAGSRVRLAATGPSQHRLDLDHGAISARVDAPPRLFVVGTRAATAVDLGCAYTLRVDEQGKGLLRVKSGFVSLEDGGRSSLVQAGAACETRPGKGPGTPWFEDAPSKLREALARFDFEDGGAAALDAILASARARDAITIWHLVRRADEGARDRVIERLRALAPPPKSVSMRDARALDDKALNRWRDAITGVPEITW
jgi:ferric-dicitrate binding protein FerR (iron transport regulator)